MRRAAKKTILNVKPYVPGKPIEEVQRELGIKHVIKLASNESPFGPSPKVLKAITRTSRAINRYPDGDCFYLRQALAKKLKVAPRQLIFGNGSDEIIVLAIRAFVGPGDEVILAKPSFLVYDIASRIAGAKLKAVPLKNFHYDLKAMKRAVSRRTKIIFLGNPDNPSGQYLPKKEVFEFLKGLRKDILVFFDEAYYEFVRARDYGYALGLAKRNKNIIVTRTFSKMYGLAGLRIGYGVADEELIDLLNRIREPFNVNSLAQAAAVACLNDASYYRRIADRIEQERKYLYRELNRLGLSFVQSCTNFILINMKRNGQEVSKQLMRRGIIVRDMGFWGLKNYIRVTIGSFAENRAFIRRLEEIL
ncbi:MAG TPA: histidinol-phosphate transaminase [Candidatus Omnitrophota bacterium]|nr:histidinol-phosphate transaminase [Candidatus Omnitrophota bacterium]